MSATTLNAANAINGPAFVEFGGVALGLTTRDGVAYATEFTTNGLEASQTQVTPRFAREAVGATLTAQFYELSLDRLRLFHDLAAPASNGVLEMAYAQSPTERSLVLTMPGPKGKGRIFESTAIIMSPGEQAFNRGSFASPEVEFGLVGDPASESYGRIIEFDLSAAAPSVSSTASSTDAFENESALAEDGTVDPDAELQVVFSQPVRPDQLSPSLFSLRTDAGTADIPVALRYGRNATGNLDYAKVIVAPVSPLAGSTDHVLRVAGGIRSLSGVPSVAAFVRNFATTA